MRNNRDRSHELFERVASARRAELLIDLVLFAGHADDRREQILSCRFPVSRGREAKPLPLKQGAGKQPAFVSARSGQRRQQIVEAGLDQLDGSLHHQLGISCSTRLDGAENRARSRRERGAKQHPVDDGVFVALLEPRADLSIVALDPAGPCSVHLRRGQLVEFGRKRSLQLGQNRAGLAETNESGRSDGVRRACGDKQQDADSPDVRVRNGPILTVFAHANAE